MNSRVPLNVILLHLVLEQNHCLFPMSLALPEKSSNYQIVMRIYITVILMVLSGFSVSIVNADSDYSMEARAAFQYLNQIRAKTGMVPFKWSDILEQSAIQHADYLMKNGLISHLEIPGLPGFSGVNPGERAIARGYEVRKVTENYSSGRKDSLESIDGLMSAIYHRFGFLDFTKNEIGIALSGSKNSFNFVYNMGNDNLNRFCKYAIDIRKSPFYEGICLRSKRVSADRVDKIEAKTAEKNPEYVIWPVDQSAGTSTVFYEEMPHPLPGRAVSGYPVSFQLNPAHYSRVKLLQFKLFKDQGKTESEIISVHILNKRSDPNQRLSTHQFALFPLERLEWGTRYRVSVALLADRKKLRKDWTFTTKNLPHPMFEIPASGNSLDVTGNKIYAVYIPPVDHFPYIEKLQVESPYKVRVDVTWEDRNTVFLKLSGAKCQPVHFYLNGNRYFSMRLNDSDNLNPDHYYPADPEINCLN